MTWNWITKLRQGKDVGDLSRAEAEAVETPHEREISSGDIEAMQADSKVTELTGGTRSDWERLGE